MINYPARREIAESQMKRVFFLIALFAASPVAAQQQTTCQTAFNSTYCTTYPGVTTPMAPVGPDYNSLLNAGRSFADTYQQGQMQALQRRQMQLQIQQQADLAASRQRMAEQATAERNARVNPPQVGMVSRPDLIQSIASLIVDGKCDVAERTLKDMGEDELLKQTIAACLATSQANQP